jgi:hypothetical protein
VQPRRACGIVRVGERVNIEAGCPHRAQTRQSQTEGGGACGAHGGIGQRGTGFKGQERRRECERWHTPRASCLDAVWLPGLSHCQSHLASSAAQGTSYGPCEVTLICLGPRLLEVLLHRPAHTTTIDRRDRRWGCLQCCCWLLTVQGDLTSKLCEQSTAISSASHHHVETFECDWPWWSVVHS